jgi:hypothetical protein
MAKKATTKKTGARKAAAKKASTKPKPKSDTAQRPAVSRPDVTPGKGVDLIGSIKVPPTNHVKSFIPKLRNMKAEVNAKSGEIGKAVAEAVEKHHYDRKALSIARQLEQLAHSNPSKFSITYNHLVKMMDDLDFERKANEQIEMFSQQAESDEDDGQSDIEDQPASGKDEAAEAATGLAPGRRPSMRIVPRDNDAA